jgi:signal transduction histidine kinase
VSNERLTRHEISWLLAQEARGAARALREGVTRLTNPPPTGEPPPSAPSVHTTLDALDGAIGMLSALQAEPTSKPAHRRGRIDLAALLCDVAPNARIQMAPGEGTEVFGDEGELRRILHMLVNQTHANPSGAGSTASPEIEIRRDADFVKISVDLGPDSSATAELERRWLSRMAVQHGGKLEFKGGRQAVFLPADGASDQREVVELRRELEQAQQLGEAYARELASVFSSGIAISEAREPAPTPPGTERFAALVTLAARLEPSLKDLAESAREDAALAASELGNQSTLAQRLSRRAASAHDLLRELTPLARCPTEEIRIQVSAVAVVNEVLDALAPRSARDAVEIRLEAPDECTLLTHPQAFKLMMRSLVEHALLATPRDTSIRILLSATKTQVLLRVIDAGTNVPISARRGLLERAKDPTHMGRPGGLSLLIAHAVAGRLGASLTLGETEDAETETRVQLARE